MADPNALRGGAVSLELPLSLMDYPSKYNLLFYTAESYKSNEVRQFTKLGKYSSTKSRNNHIPKQYNDKTGTRTDNSG